MSLIDYFSGLQSSPQAVRSAASSRLQYLCGTSTLTVPNTPRLSPEGESSTRSSEKSRNPPRCITCPQQKLCKSSSSKITFHTSFTMAGLLSLHDALIELVIEQVIGTQQLGLRDWCRAASTCKRLWEMQLPGEETAWCVHLDPDMKGEYETRGYNLRTVICHACAVTSCWLEQVHSG